MNLKVKYLSLGEDLGYCGLIEKFITTNKPDFSTKFEDKVEAILNLFITSRNIRLGPAPDITQKFHMMEVIRKTMEDGKPLKVITGCGPKKTKSGESIDLAEYSMLNVLADLHSEISQFYAPGILVIIRLEDNTGHILEPDHIDDMVRYIDDFKKLVNVLGYNNFIKPIAESELCPVKDFKFETNRLIPHFEKYIYNSLSFHEDSWDTLPEYHKLEELGWSGIINKEQRESYIIKYEKLYPELGLKEYINLMIKYFAYSLARKRLKVTGKDLITLDGKNGNMEIFFMPPVPGYTYKTRLYYRGIEMKQTKKALPFWRAKAFLKISEDNQIKISNVTWSDSEKMEFNSGKLVIVNDQEDSIEIACDYILTD